MNGNYNLVTEDMLFNVPEQGVTGKDTSFVVDSVLLAATQMSRGEKVGAVVLDCAGTNTSTMVAAYLPVLMVKLGAFESFIVMFFQKYHSKSYCDKLFGALRTLLEYYSAMIPEELAALADRMMRRDEGANCTLITSCEMYVDHSAFSTSAMKVSSSKYTGDKGMGFSYGYSEGSTVADPFLKQWVEDRCRPGSGGVFKWLSPCGSKNTLLDDLFETSSSVPSPPAR